MRMMYCWCCVVNPFAFRRLSHFVLESGCRRPPFHTTSVLRIGGCHSTREYCCNDIGPQAPPAACDWSSVVAFVATVLMCAEGCILLRINVQDVQSMPRRDKHPSTVVHLVQLCNVLVIISPGTPFRSCGDQLLRQQKALFNSAHGNSLAQRRAGRGWTCLSHQGYTLRLPLCVSPRWFLLYVVGVVASPSLQAGGYSHISPCPIEVI